MDADPAGWPPFLTPLVEVPLDHPVYRFTISAGSRR
jgi:hypothetical protein